MKNIIISASILSADFSKLGEQIKKAEEGGVDWIHVDVMDGQFVPNITMGPFIVETCRKITNLPLDVHLMIEKPENHIGSFIDAGANRLSIHVENNPNVFRTLQEIRALGGAPGIVINPGTPACAINALYKAIDHVLVMTVNPGFSGQSFIESNITKIKEIKRHITDHDLPVKIQVDGGITPETLPKVYNAGAELFVVATAIFKTPNGISDSISDLRNSIN